MHNNIRKAIIAMNIFRIKTVQFDEATEESNQDSTASDGDKTALKMLMRRIKKGQEDQDDNDGKSPLLTEFDKIEGISFIESKRGNAESGMVGDKELKINLKDLRDESRTGAIAKKSTSGDSGTSRKSSSSKSK